jgi:L-threonylcarbamoyladenylate synthase
VAEGARIGALVISGDPARHGALTLGLRLPDDAAVYASTLYDTLHAADEAGCSEILVERPPDAPAWDAVHDRLTRAAHAG